MAPRDTRIILLESVYSLMLADVYSAPGVHEICRHAGVRNGFFYHRVPTR